MDGWQPIILKKIASYEMLHRGRFFDRGILRFTELLHNFGIRENFHNSGIHYCIQYV
jgi:hypothetical protein